MAYPRVFAHMVRASRMEEFRTEDRGRARSAANDWWGLDELSGRLTELSGPSRLTLACSLVREAQRSAAAAVWVSATPHTFFPPDLARSGVVLDELPVVRVPGAAAAGRAADWLIRSSGFGLVVVDLGADLRADPGLRGLSMALQGRLAQLARRNGTAVVFLTEKEPGAPSLSSLITLRGQALRRPAGPFRFACELSVLKDKRRGPGWRHREVFHGPAGLR